MFENDKIKMAFKLSDLLYFREKEKLSLVLGKEISKISDLFESRGLFYSGPHISEILKKRIEFINQLVNFRVNQDIEEIDKVFESIPGEVYNEIFERSKQLIEGCLDNLKYEMENFCKHFPYPDSYLAIVKSRIQEEKNKLIGYAKREVEIKQRESEVKIDKDRKEKSIIYEIIEKIDSINLLMNDKYKIKLFDIQEQKIWNSLFEVCQDKEDFVPNITALSSLIDWINIKGLRSILKTKPPDGSINYLERFLQEKYPDYDKNIIKRMRRINKIRQMSPVHKDTIESIKAIEELGESYSDTNYGKLWDKILLDFYASLRQLEEILLY